MQLHNLTLSDHTKSKFCFFAYALKKKKKKKRLPTLNFLSRFLFLPSFSTFASRAFLFVRKNTNKSRTGCAKLAKELKPSHKTKTRAKKFILPASTSWVVLCLSTILRTNTYCNNRLIKKATI